jgi:hypothetical protein
MPLETKGAIWILCDTGSEYQPYSWFGRSSFTPNNVQKIKGYNHWLSIFDDVWGFYIDVFYPKSVKDGDPIKLIIFHPKGRKRLLNQHYDFLSWFHGLEGVFANEILPILERY